MKTKSFLILSILIASSSSALAMEQIVRPYQSVRSSGMGGVKITTGLYDENLYGNPARALANPRFRLTLLDPMAEVNGTSIHTVGDLAGAGSDTLQKIGTTAGSNNHGRVQFTMPSLYFPPSDSGKMAFAAGLVNSVQFDINLRQSYQINPQATLDSAFVFEVARKFLADDALAVGINARAAARANLKDNITFAEFLRDSSLGAKNIGGEGTMVNLDLGSTYMLPFQWQEFSFQAGLAINNLMGGTYTKLGDLSTSALEQPRTFGFGVAARKAALWKFTDFVAAFEVSDINNSNGGSMFRLFHLGAEARYGILAPRLGLNQGYWTVGLGVLTRIATIEYAYYGEEMGLNPGTYQDYRHAIKFALQI